jgi:hypothetical protein
MERAMNRNPARPELTVSNQLHPLIYAGMAALVALFVVSAFVFADGGYADYLLAVVTGFFIIVMAIPFILWRVWRGQGGQRIADGETLREWSDGECDTWQSRIPAREAAVMSLLPIAAVSFGLAAIGVVLMLVEHNMI